MSLSDYNFITDAPEVLSHLALHLECSAKSGSRFFKEIFPDVDSLIEFTLPHVRDHSGTRMVVELVLPQEIGYDGLVLLDGLPASARITREPRGKSEYPVNIVRGIPPVKTRRMVIIAGPLDENHHGFYTIFPGTYAPPHPKTEKQLRELGLKDEALVTELARQEQYRNFWKKYGLIE